jgi:NO-binding membrane sensor protein with MHYT domain
MLMAHSGMNVTYDLPMVALSILIASISAYVALSVGERLTHNQGCVRYFWLAGGASAMGTGIWSMHSPGLLASSTASLRWPKAVTSVESIATPKVPWAARSLSVRRGADVARSSASGARR